jgi:hypothetical protein
MKLRPSFLGFLAAAMSFIGLGGPSAPSSMAITPAQPRRGRSKRGGGRMRALPWRKRCFRAMRGVAVPDWPHGEPIYVVPTE